MGMTIHCSSACQNRGFTYIARRAIKVRVSCPVTLTFCRIHNARFTGMYYDVVAESPNVSVRFESNHKTVYRWRFFRQSIRYMIRTVQGIFFFTLGYSESYHIYVSPRYTVFCRMTHARKRTGHRAPTGIYTANAVSSEIDYCYYCTYQQSHPHPNTAAVVQGI